MTYYLKTKKGEYVVKIYPNCNEDHLQSETSLVASLYENGLSVPRVIKTKDQQGYAILDRIGYAVFAYIQGKQVTVEQIDPWQARRLGEGLGLLHQSGQKLPELSARQTRGIEYINQVHHTLLNLPSNYSDNPEFNRNRTIFFKECKRLEKLLVESRWKGFKGLIHSDLTLDNVIFSCDKVVIIDFGDAGTGYLLMDLAILILGAAVTPAEYKPALAQAIIDGYYSIQNVFKEEEGELVNMLQVACLRKAAAYFDYFVTRNITLHKNKQFLDKIPYLKEFKV